MKDEMPAPQFAERFKMKDAMTQPRTRMTATILPPSSFILAVAVLAILSACSKGEAKDAKGAAGGPPGGRKSMEFPVEVHPVESRDVEYSITAVGSLDAFERVAVT